MEINKRSEEIAKFVEEWRTNRAMVEGERAVKALGDRFIPRNQAMDAAAHANLVRRTRFYPGAARTHQGLKALATHKPATVKAPPNVADILNTITVRGQKLESLATQCFSELLITNFVGLLVDYPESPAGMTKAEAVDAGVRPYIGLYTGENVLNIETGVINNRLRVIRVVLSDDPENIRELRLDNHIYTVTKWKLIKQKWVAVEVITPTKAGTPLDEIPFALACTEEEFSPAKAPLTDVCNLNAQLFLECSNSALLRWYQASPIPLIIRKHQDDDPELNVAPGEIWLFDNDPAEVEAKYLESSGVHAADFRAEVDSLKSDIAKMGIAMLADEKAAAEAAETHAIRRASENAIVASYVRARDRALNDALAWVAWWLDLAEDAITFEGNTAFNVAPIEAQMLTFLKSLKDDCTISRDTFLDLMIEHDILPASYDRELDAQKIAEEVADRPPAIVMTVNEPDQPST